ncbi:MAG: hypothetical protein J6B95_08160 [Oscillospiraceae bacterium]|nr:hypothetical protein [Oscillospiraceae bacterium]
MTKAYWNDCTIDGNPILVPDQDLEITRTDLDSDDSGRDESGVMHRIPVRHRVYTWVISYSSLKEDECEYLRSLIDGKSEFEFVIFGETYTAYCSNDAVTVRNAVTGDYRNFQLKIIEC